MANSIGTAENLAATLAHQTEKTLDQEAIELDPHLDKKLDRKFDLHIIPWLFGIW